MGSCIGLRAPRGREEDLTTFPRPSENVDPDSEPGDTPKEGPGSLGSSESTTPGRWTQREHPDIHYEDIHKILERKHGVQEAGGRAAIPRSLEVSEGSDVTDSDLGTAENVHLWGAKDASWNSSNSQECPEGHYEEIPEVLRRKRSGQEVPGRAGVLKGTEASEGTRRLDSNPGATGNERLWGEEDVARNSVHYQERPEGHYEEISDILRRKRSGHGVGGRTRVPGEAEASEEPGTPDDDYGATENTAGNSGHYQRPEGHYEEIPIILRRKRSVQEVGGRAGVPGQSEACKGPVTLDSDPRTTGNVGLWGAKDMAGNSSNYQEHSEGHYEEIPGILRKKQNSQEAGARAGAPRRPELLNSDPRATENVRLQGEDVAGNSSHYQEIDEMRRVRDLLSRPVPRPPTATNTAVKKPKRHVYTEPDLAPGRGPRWASGGTHTYAEPGEGTRGSGDGSPGRRETRHQYTELEPRLGRSTNYYTPDPTRGPAMAMTSNTVAQLPLDSASTTFNPRIQSIPGPDKGLCPADLTNDPKLRPLPDPKGKFRPFAPTSDLVARPLPEPDWSLRPDDLTFDSTARPLLDPAEPNPDLNTKTRTLPDPKGSLRPAALTFEPTFRPLPDPDLSLRPSDLTFNPKTQPLPDPKGRFRPAAPTSDLVARPLPEPDWSLRPDDLTFDSTARPLLDPAEPNPDLNTKTRTLPDPKGSLRPAALTFEPTFRPLPDPDLSLRPSDLTFNPKTQPLPDPKGRFRPAAPTSDLVARPLPEPDWSLRPDDLTFDSTARPLLDPAEPNPDLNTKTRTLPDPKGSLRPAALTFEPTFRPLPDPDLSLRPSDLTFNPKTQPLPDPKGRFRPAAPTSDLVARPLPEPDWSLRPDVLTFDSTARPLLDPAEPNPDLNTKTRTLPDPKGSLRPAALTFNPKTQPLPDPRGSVMPTDLTSESKTQPMPEADWSLSLADLTSDQMVRALPEPEWNPTPTGPKAQPLPDPEGNLRPAMLTSDTTARPNSDQSLRPINQTSDPGSPQPENPDLKTGRSPRPRIPAKPSAISDPAIQQAPGPEHGPRSGEAAPPIYAQPMRRRRGPAPQLDNAVYGALPSAPRPTPRPEVQPRPVPRSLGTRPSPGPGSPEVMSRPVPNPPKEALRRVPAPLGTSPKPGLSPLENTLSGPGPADTAQRVDLSPLDAGLRPVPVPSQSVARRVHGPLENIPRPGPSLQDTDLRRVPGPLDTSLRPAPRPPESRLRPCPPGRSGSPRRSAVRPDSVETDANLYESVLDYQRPSPTCRRGEP
ncbi:uncharacterized protein [Hemitrygon akajei]|uniref:uncharacterized protein n=1 Tax=Hemitrygon akajei TaxID=2704970 RepID=UPI003BF95F83